MSFSSNRFNVSRGPEIFGPNVLSKQQPVPPTPTSNDPDLVFLNAIKNSMLIFNKIEIIQSLPSKPLNDFHLKFLIDLSSKSQDSFYLIDHIIKSYKFDIDPVLQNFYLSKFDRIRRTFIVGNPSHAPTHPEPESEPDSEPESDEEINNISATDDLI